MMDEFKALLMKKKKEGKELSEPAKKAKLSALGDLKGLADDHIREDMRSAARKVTVSADSKEGLEVGLDKAKEVVEAAPEGDDEEEMVESDEEDLSHCSPEELDQKIAELQALKDKLKAKV